MSPKLIPLTLNDLKVLEWFSEWTPEVHKADWKNRRAWPPGFRAITDCSTYSDKIRWAQLTLAMPPELTGDKPGRPITAKLLVPRLLSFRLLEGDWNCARLTARGRAALLFHGMACPSAFKSHADNVFDAFDLRPILGKNVRLDFDDRIMKRLDPVYLEARRGDHLPDDKQTWGLMLEEYSADSYRSSGGLTGCSARLTIASTGPRGKALNGSLRLHNSYPTLAITDDNGRTVTEISMSFEGLAELLVASHNVPVTVDAYNGPDGMIRSLPVPDPLSISRRVRERVKKSQQDAVRWVKEASELIENGRIGKKLQAELLQKLELAERDFLSQGAYPAQQAMEEVSSVAESLMTIMVERSQNAQLLGVERIKQKLQAKHLIEDAEMERYTRQVFPDETEET